MVRIPAVVLNLKCRLLIHSCGGMASSISSYSALRGLQGGSSQNKQLHAADLYLDPKYVK